jgi:hypothetical protein
MVGWVHVYSPVVAPSEVSVSHCGETTRQVSIVAKDIQIATADSVKVDAIHQSPCPCRFVNFRKANR